MVLALVANTNKHEYVFGALPHCVQSHLGFRNVVRDADLLWKLVSHELTLGIVSEVISLELPFIIMSWLEPSNHGVLIGLLDLVLISPFVGFCLINVERLTLNVQWVFVVAQLESVVVVPSLLLNAQVTRFRECYDRGLVRLFVEKVMGSPFELICQQIEDCDGITAGLNYNSLFVRHHAKGIHGFLEHMLKKDISPAVHVCNTVLPQPEHSQKNKCIIDGWVQIQNLMV